MEFRSDVIDLPEGKISYFVGGEGRDVLYLHPAAGMRFTPPIHKLAKHFRVWAPIVPGFDGTDPIEGIDSMQKVAALYAGFVDTLIGGPCDIVGQSLGSWLGAWFTILYPDKVGQLVLGSPAGFRPADAPPLAFDRETFLAQLHAHPERRPPDDKPPEITERNGQMLRENGWSTSHDAALIARIGEIECLTMILHGTKDVRVPQSAVQMLRARIPRSQLIYIYDAAHGIEVDQPERVGAVIVDFLLRAEAFIVNPGDAPDVGAVDR